MIHANLAFCTIGKGTFGVVLQAKAEDIMKSAPHRNIVAVKTTRGTDQMCICEFIILLVAAKIS